MSDETECWEVLGDLAWQSDAACLEIDVDAFDPFFVGRGHSTRPAKAICGGCAVRQECLEFAQANHIVEGVWGGLSANERKALTRTSPTVREVAAGF